MAQQHFFIKLIPPRITFQQDMTDAERTLMQTHILYWRGLIEAGSAVIFGPVMDANGGYGMGVIEADNEQTARALIEQDPTILSATGFAFEVYPMRVGMVRKQA